MAKLTMRGTGSVGGTAAQIISGLEGSAFSCTLVDRADKRLGGAAVTLLVFEKYYMRAGNRASLSVLITGDGKGVSVDAVSSGGGHGVLFSFSWGAESSFTENLRNILTDIGFH